MRHGVNAAVLMAPTAVMTINFDNCMSLLFVDRRGGRGMMGKRKIKRVMKDEE